MVEHNAQLDLLFMALSDTTRRNILSLVGECDMTIGEIARHYKLTFAAISKHIQVLEKAGFVTKRRRGREQMVTIVPDTLTIAREHIERYASMWEERYDRLEKLLKEK